MVKCNFYRYGEGGWSCLKLITVGLDSYSVDLKHSRLVKCKLK